ncbi:MAG: response regulator [Patescibacteria group bacterium]
MPKILIVDDDLLMIKMYTRIFTHEGFTALTAQNGPDGLNKARTESPDLILLDVMMPKMNGLEVLSELKKSNDTKAIPVIMLTNLAGQQDAENALERGAMKYVIKSEHEPKEVSKIVRDALAHIKTHKS